MSVARNIEQVNSYVRQIRLRQYARDQRMANVRAARSGEVSHIMPGMLPDTWPKPIVANLIDISARFTAEQIGATPTVSCTSGVMVSDLQKRYAQKRTLIVHEYMAQSRLKQAMVPAADWYDTYGFVPLLVEPHMGDAFTPPGPRLRYENPMGVYYDLDAYGTTRCYIKVYEEDVAVLCAQFPHLANGIVQDAAELTTGRRIEMVFYMDPDQSTIYLPERNNLVISSIPNPFGRVPVFIAERAKFDTETHGSYDDVVWIQLARAKFAMLGLEAAEKSINAPLAIPADVQKISIGPDAVIRTNNPQMVRRVGLEMSPAAFQIGELLNDEAMVGARFPEGATGKSPGSVVTGRGMDSLMGTVDTKVRVAQDNMGAALERALSLALEMDQKFWPRLQRFLRVQVNGATFEETYTPAKDIKSVYQVDVSYGMAAGMDPNRAIVFLLQARGDKLISRDFALRQLPFDINVDQEMERVDTEELNDALKQGLFSMLGALGVMAQQGADPQDLVRKAATVIKEREKGVPLADAVMKAFQPPPPPPGSGPPGASPDATQGPGGPPPAPGAAPGGGAPPSGPPGGAQPPQGMGPNGQSVMQMIAGLTGGGQPNMTANVSRTQPSG
jgi:hypothetical protein